MEPKNLVLESIDHCKRVQPIMKRLGIEKDAVWCKTCSKETWRLDPINWSNFTDWVPTYRQDKLELALPEWVWDRTLTSTKAEKILGYPKDCVFFDHISKLRDDVVHLVQGEPKRQATVDLIYLLDKEGLL